MVIMGKRIIPILLVCLSSFCILFILSGMIFPDSFSITTKHFPLSESNRKRTVLYDKIERDLELRGPIFLEFGNTSQSLSLSDIFTRKDGVIFPLLKMVNPPIRATVLHLNPEYAVPISETIRQIFSPHFDKVIWFQNSSLYHFSMFHTSHHIEPVLASKDEIEEEAAAVKVVARSLCPLRITLDRVILTSTGVLLGCWQVVSGTDPVNIRADLRHVLPRAPIKQFYDHSVLHVSFARILGPPKEGDGRRNTWNILNKLVHMVDRKLHYFEAVVWEVWFVEEYDLLALALNGKMKVRSFTFGCS